jgi:hypothetical protein
MGTVLLNALCQLTKGGRAGLQEGRAVAGEERPPGRVVCCRHLAPCLPDGGVRDNNLGGEVVERRGRSSRRPGDGYCLALPRHRRAARAHRMSGACCHCLLRAARLYCCTTVPHREEEGVRGRWSTSRPWISAASTPAVRRGDWRSARAREAVEEGEGATPVMPTPVPPTILRADSATGPRVRPLEPSQPTLFSEEVELTTSMRVGSSVKDRLGDQRGGE